MHSKPIYYIIVGLSVFGFALGLSISSTVSAGPSDCCFYQCPPGCQQIEVGGYYDKGLMQCVKVSIGHECFTYDCMCW